MSVAQNSANAPSRGKTSVTDIAVTNDALDSAVAEVGAHPERASELAAELGIGMDENTGEYSMPVKLQDGDPSGPPMRITHNKRDTLYALQHPSGRLVAEGFDETLTDRIDFALIADNWGEAYKLRDIYQNYRFKDGLKLEIVSVQFGYKGRPTGVKAVDGPPEPDELKDLNLYTAAMALAADEENDHHTEGDYIAHTQCIFRSPLWPMVKAQFEKDVIEDAKEREDWDWENAPLSLYTRGLLAGMHLGRLQRKAKAGAR